MKLAERETKSIGIALIHIRSLTFKKHPRYRRKLCVGVFAHYSNPREVFAQIWAGV
jgi:hypothetical protein